MENMISEKQDEGKISQYPIIIAHSMGGLVSRSYIIASSGNFHRLVTLSTPHLGSTLAHFVPFGDEIGVGDLIPGHNFLNNLNSNSFEKTQRSKYWLLNGRVGTYPSCEKCIGDHCKYFCYHWHNPMPTIIEKVGHGKLDKPNDGMVTNASARFTGNQYYEEDNNVHRVATFEWIDHKQLNKDHRICKWVKEFINDHQ
jgi:triacylglycerol esterase/lipase EstA (alpha/beta hydrolase family)